MNLLELSPIEYKKVIKEPAVIFNSVDFNLINSEKCDSIKYLVFRDKKNRLGIIGGIKDREFRSPFSAPYGGFSVIYEPTRITHYYEAVSSLNNYALTTGLKSILITLPPCFYHKTHNAKQVSALINSGFSLAWVDINLSFDLSNFLNFPHALSKKSRYDLRIGIANQLRFSLCSDELSKEQAYQVILQNHLEKGYPMRMSFEAIQRTANIVSIDYFLIEYELEQIAAAIVFHVNSSVAQVIYWGSLPKFDNLQPMAFLAYHLFDYYYKQGKKILDIGPSSLEGKVNFGLADFKENLGCEYSLKCCFRKNYND